jgi:hypothetical protein
MRPPANFLSPNGKVLLKEGSQGQFLVWDVRRRKELSRIARKDLVLGNLGSPLVADSPDGRMLATVPVGGFARFLEERKLGRIYFWRSSTGKRMRESDRFPGDVPAYGLAFSPDGKVLATGDVSEPVLRLWEVASGRLRAEFKGHEGAVMSVAFSPDGSLLASGSEDTTVLLWDVWGRAGRQPGRKLSAKDLAALWADLGNPNAEKAFRAARGLVNAPGQAVGLLREHVRPLSPPVPGRIRQLVADLESPRFGVRDKAARELVSLEEAAEPALRKALAGSPSLEFRRRVEQLLDRLHAPVPPPEVLRRLRAVEVLEAVGTPEARRLLEKLADGRPTAQLTREARTSLQRLSHSFRSRSPREARTADEK